MPRVIAFTDAGGKIVNKRRAVGRTTGASAALAAVNVSVLLVACMHVLDRHDETGIAPAVFDDFFLLVVIAGLVNGAVLAGIRATRHVGIGIVLGTVFAALCLSVVFVAIAAGAGSLS